MSLRRDRGIWHQRYWEHTIRNDRDYAAHMDYSHFNPVKHGLVAKPSDWPFSSFHRAVSVGLIQRNEPTAPISAWPANGGNKRRNTRPFVGSAFR
jgi:putative transposase